MIMDPDHEDWESFIKDLCIHLFDRAGRDISEVDSRKEVLEILFKGCDSKLNATTYLLKEYEVDIEKSLEYLTNQFGKCDCEIFGNSRK